MKNDDPTNTQDFPLRSHDTNNSVSAPITLTMNSPCTLRDQQHGRYEELSNQVGEPSPESVIFGGALPAVVELGQKCFILELPDQRAVELIRAEDEEDDEDLQFLGGQQEGGAETRDHPYNDTSVVINFSRPRKIPVSRRLSSMQPPVYPQCVVNIFEILMSGPLFVVVLENNSGFQLKAVVEEPTHEEDSPSRSSKTCTFCYHVDDSPRMSIQGDHYNMDIWDTLNKHQRLAVAHRVLHRVLRSHGCRLPKTFLLYATKMLLDSYLRCQLYTEALDVAILFVDLAISNNWDAKLVNATADKLAAVLFACRRFSEAGSIWLEVAAKTRVNENYLSNLHHNAALAFYRGGNFALVEECFVKALFYHKSVSLWTDSSLKTTWKCLLCTYFDEREMLGAITEQSFLGLLSVSGFPFSELGGGEAMSRAAKSFARGLKRSFRKAAGARQALIDATSTDSVQTFRSKLRSCYNSKIAIGGIEVRVALRATRRREFAAKVFEPSGGRILPEVCYGPGCAATENLNMCPCHTVCYCSKGCQLSHWRHSHKHNCPDRLNSDSQN